jgi:hypothetical protein
MFLNSKIFDDSFKIKYLAHFNINYILLCDKPSVSENFHIYCNCENRCYKKIDEFQDNLPGLNEQIEYSKSIPITTIDYLLESLNKNLFKQNTNITKETNICLCINV